MPSPAWEKKKSMGKDLKRHAESDEKFFIVAGANY